MCHGKTADRAVLTTDRTHCLFSATEYPRQTYSRKETRGAGGVGFSDFLSALQTLSIIYITFSPIEYIRSLTNSIRRDSPTKYS
jgi:hypothetical protein